MPRALGHAALRAAAVAVLVVAVPACSGSLAASSRRFVLTFPTAERDT